MQKTAFNAKRSVSQSVFFIYSIAQGRDGDSKKSPQKTVQRTYLTAEIKAHIWIIPDVKLQTDIEYKSGYQLKKGYDAAADNALYHKSDIWYFLKNFVQHSEANAPCQYHWPMRVSSR